MLTIDVQKAFNALLKRRLLEQMRKQGFGSGIRRLLDSFLTERQVIVRLEKTKIGEYTMECGIPQGSPLSLVLDMLHLSKLLCQDARLWFGYADDINLYRATLEESME